MSNGTDQTKREAVGGKLSVQRTGAVTASNESGTPVPSSFLIDREAWRAIIGGHYPAT